MKISHRLIASAAFSSAGLLAIACVSFLAVTSIRDDLLGLTTRATPLQNKTHETQERTERLMANLLRMTLVSSAADAERLAQAARTETAELQRLQGELRQLDASSSSDMAGFEKATQSIAGAVDRRLEDEARYRTETASAAQALQQAEQAVAATRQGAGEIEKDAIRATDAAQEQSRRLAEMLKQHLAADSRLKQMALLTSEVGAVAQASRLPTVRAEVRAAAAALQQVEAGGETAPVLAQVKVAAAEIQDMFLHESKGLVALREAALRPGGAADADYGRQRARILDAIDKQSQSLAEAVDEIELKSVKQRQLLEEALKLRNEPGGVIVLSQSASLAVREAVAALRLLMLADTPDDAAKVYAGFRLLSERLAEDIQQVRAGMLRLKKPQLAQQAEAALQAMERVKASGAKVSESRLKLLASRARTDEALNQLKIMANARAEAGAQQVKSIAMRQSEVVQAVSERVRTALWFIALASGLIIIAAVIINARTITTVRSRLDMAVAVAETVSRGELRAVAVPAGQDETTRLIGALRAMVDILTGTVTHIRDSAQSIETGTSEIAHGNLDLSERTEQQAAGLQTTASAMLALSRSVNQNAEGARAASALAAAANDSASEGGNLVAEMVTNMDQIHGASQQVRDIVGVIENIAFRTNLLALNAAVEAAQAGTHGQGFAVVAHEVRELARQAGTAAQDIKALITNTVERIELGHHRAEVAGKAMLDIVDQTLRVNQHVSAIADATMTQATSIDQLRMELQRLEGLTQQNAALAEETSAATHALRGQAEELNTAIAVFKVAHPEQTS